MTRVPVLVRQDRPGFVPLFSGVTLTNILRMMIGTVKPVRKDGFGETGPGFQECRVEKPGHNRIVLIV
jgi:hypothetical protein